MDEEDKQVLEFLEDSEREARKPKKIKHKDVFPDIKKSQLKDIKMTDIKKHNFSELQLKGMKVADLKKVVREHNLHTAITNYSKLRKADLISKMMKYAGGKSTKKSPITDSTYIKRGPEKVKKKKQKANPKTKAMPRMGSTVSLVPELAKPLYKEGVIKGAKKQFKRRPKQAVKTRPQRNRRPPDKFQ